MNKQILSFQDLWTTTDRTSSGLKRLGLKPGDRVVLMIPMSCDLYVSLLAVLQLGGVAVFVDPWVSLTQIASMAAFVEPRALIGTFKSHLLRWWDARLRAIPLAVTTSHRWGPLPAPVSLRQLGQASGDTLIQPVLPEDPALITFTTGSSGSPKGANRTHGFLTAQHHTLTQEFSPQDQDVDMPMFPIFALNNLAIGIPSVIPQMDFRHVDRVDPRVILDQLSQHGVTTCMASPPFFDRLAAYVSTDPTRRPRLRRILTGGAPVSDEQLTVWRQIFPDTEILIAYGSTEAEPVAHLHAEDRLALIQSHPNAKGFCTGAPIRSITARLVKLHRGSILLTSRGWTDWDVPPGEIGELIVTGNHVSKDYYRNPEAVAENKILHSDGTIWHRMGDTGYWDDAGRFWLVGRLHSTIYRSGIAVHPQLVEEAARKGDARIKRVAAVGLPHPTLGEQVIVVAESDMGESLREDILHRLQSAGHPVDRVIVTSKPLPVDPRHNVKIDYPQVRAWIQNHFNMP